MDATYGTGSTAGIRSLIAMADARPELPLDPDRPPPHLTGAGVGLVFVGGVLGTAARYGVGEAVGPWGPWPAATFCVNVVGAFLLGCPHRGVEPSRSRCRCAATAFACSWGSGSSGRSRRTAHSRSTPTCSSGRGYASVAVAYAVGTVVVGFLATWSGIWAATAQRRGTPQVIVVWVAIAGGLGAVARFVLDGLPSRTRVVVVVPPGRC